MDVDCGSGDITSEILLPVLDKNTLIIGKKTNL